MVAMITRAPVQPHMLEWALQRSGKRPEDLNKFPVKEWLEGRRQPTVTQLEGFAEKVHVPFGYLFLPEPPKEDLPISDFRTVESRRIRQPSLNLLDTVYNYQECQSWYHEFAKAGGYDSVGFVGTATTEMAHEEAAKSIREALGFHVADRDQYTRLEDVLRFFIGRAEKIGVLVMINGVVGCNPWRALNVKEFRGFVLTDDITPLIFINGKDSKHAQIFTLAHELAHLWLGESGISDATAQPLAFSTSKKEEVWCNQVAAELLVPLDELREHLRGDEPIDETVKRLKRHFKVSGFVILRRLLDVKRLTHMAFDAAWDEESERVDQEMTRKKRRPGGDFYNNMGARMSKPFIRALVGSALEGKTLYRDAFRMLGIKNNMATLEEMGRKAGVSI